jgi:hypothetical protein
MARIAFVSTMGGYQWGGSEELWSQAASRLLAKGHTVGASVIWRRDPAKQLLALQEQGGLVTQRRYVRGASKLLDRVHTGWLSRFRPDLLVVALCSHQGGDRWMEECRRRAIPYAIVVQAAHESYWPDYAQTERAAACYDGARACFFVSQRNLEFLRSYLGSELDNARIVRNPFNVRYDAALPWRSTWMRRWSAHGAAAATGARWARWRRAPHDGRCRRIRRANSPPSWSGCSSPAGRSRKTESRTQA